MEGTSLSDIVNLAVLELENPSEDKNQVSVGQMNLEEASGQHSALNASDSQWINSSLAAYINSFNYSNNYNSNYSSGSIGETQHQTCVSKYYVPMPSSRGHSIFNTSRTSNSNIRSHSFRRNRSITGHRTRDRG